MFGSRVVCHSRRILFFSVISRMMKSGILFIEVFLVSGMTHLSMARCKLEVRFVIAESISEALLVEGLMSWVSVDSISQYFFQLINLFVVGGDEAVVVFEISSKIGLWSDENSLRFVTCIWNGSLVRAISSTSGLWVAADG